MSKIPKLGSLVAGFVAIFLFSLVLTRPLQKAELSSSTPNLSEFQKIPCPSATRVQELFKTFNLEFSLKGYSCDAQDSRTYLLKTLDSLSRMNFIPPKAWGDEAHHIFTNISGYLSKHINKITLSTDPESSTVVGTNPAAGLVELTPRIRELSLIEAVSMLVHETRHIQFPTLGHTRCSAGDMPAVEAACDDSFTDEYSRMASYNFEVAFLAGLSMGGTQLTTAERAFAAQYALNLIATRFNNFRNNSAFFHDVLVVLTHSSKLQIWHPYLEKWISLPINLKDDKVIRIEEADDAFSLFLFTEKGKFYSWNLFKGMKSISRFFTKNDFIVDGRRTTVAALKNDIVTTYISNGQLKIIAYEPDETGSRSQLYPFNHARDAQLYKFQKLFFGFYNELFLLSDSQRLLRVNRQLTGPNLIEIPALNSLEPWVYGTGGILFDKMYFVNEAGNLYRLWIRNKQDLPMLTENENAPESYELQQISIPVTNGIRKYKQGSFGDYFLGRDGLVTFKSLQTPTLKTLTDQAVLDFAVLKTVVPVGEYKALLNQNTAELQATCKVLESQWDPILYRGMGKTENGELVFSDFEGVCHKTALSTPLRWSTVEFQSHSKFDERILEDFTNDGANYRSVPVILFLDNHRRELARKTVEL